MNALMAWQFKNGAYLGAIMNSYGNIGVYSFFTKRPNLYNARRHFECVKAKKETLLDVVQVHDEAEWDAMGMALAKKVSLFS